MGYRFALFNYTTKEARGYVDFDYFEIETEKIIKMKNINIPKMIFLNLLILLYKIC
ncbi:hypothetical protein [Zunongwangia sp.]|uniref:hypothetical protein n=1 Tax=Zunongwangia sp. TaxID=1965325 RepID=UPI003AA8DE0F